MNDIILSLNCINCGALPEIFCKGCHSVAYCSQTCADKHWKTDHKAHHEYGIAAHPDFEIYQLETVEDGISYYEPTPEYIERKWMRGAVKRPGAFTRKARRAHRSVRQFTKMVLKHPKHYSLQTVRQANLARTFAKFRKHKRRKKEKPRAAISDSIWE